MFAAVYLMLMSVIVMALSGIVMIVKAVNSNTDNTTIVFYAGAIAFLVSLVIGCVQLQIAMW